MTRNFLLGIDIGTSASKGVLTDLQGRVIAQRSIEHAVNSPRPGWFEQDADSVWWGDLVRICRALLAESSIAPVAIAALRVSSLSPDMLPVDGNGVPLRPGMLYSDGRAQEEIEEIGRQFNAEDLYRITAKTLSSSSVGPKILWLRKHEPQTYARTRTVHTATSFLVFKLTGNAVIDHVEAAGFNPLFDAHAMQWNPDVCDALQISQALLPEIRWTTDLAGAVTATAAAATGLAEGTPVVTGTCDAFAEAVSVGAVDIGEATLSYGSTMVFTLVLDHLQIEPGMSAGPGPLPHTYKIGSSMSCASSLTRWFRDNFGAPERQAEEVTGISAYQLLSAEAATVPPGAEGLVVLPYWAGERSPIYDSRARGLVLGLTLSHTRRHFYRALIESVGYGLRHNLEIMAATGAPIKRIVATGGGTQSELWTQIVSDIVGQEQEIARNPLGAPYGNAFMAGYGAGIFADLAPLRSDWAPATTRVVPDPKAHALYDRYYEVYRTLYSANREAMHSLARLASTQ